MSTVGHGASRPTRPALKTGVLFVTTKVEPPLGADTWVLAQVMRDLDRRTTDVRAACVTGPVDAPTPTYQVLSRISDLGMHPVHFGLELSGRSTSGRLRALPSSLRAVPSVVRLAWQIRRRGIEVIHTSDRPRDALASVLLARLTGAQCLIHVHVGYGEWMSPILKWSLRRADALVAVSEFVGDTLVASGHDPARIHVVPNAIDPEVWHPGEGRHEVRQEFGVPDHAPLVVTVCRLFPSKGPEVLIRCLPAARQVHPDTTLLIVGREVVPGYRQHLAQVAHDLGVGTHVRFAEHRSDIGRVMAAADVFAMPSLGEPFGLVYLEAMAMGLPVVALHSGGAPEVIVDAVTGLLSEPGDERQLTTNLLMLLSDPERRKNMGQAGRKRVEAYFTTPRMAADMSVVYERLTSAETPQYQTDPVPVLS